MAVSRRDRLRRRLMRHAPGARRGPPAPLPDAAPLLRPGARLLILRPDHLGDLLFVGPALDRLRAARPDLAPTLLVGPWSEAVARRLPGAAAVETLAFPWFDRQPKGAPWRPYIRLARAARRLSGRFDAALVLRDDDRWSAWLCALAGIPLRLGHDHPDLRPFLSHRLEAAHSPPHAAAANLSLIEALLAGPGEPGRRLPSPGPETWPLGFRIDPADRARADALLAEIGLKPGVPGGAPGPLAVHPGAGAPIKRWRSGAWAELLEALTTPGEALVLTGGPDEAPLTAGLARLLERPVLDLAGRTDLGTLAAVYARCRLVLGPDSGPLHLAVAVGTPSLHLYGPADAARFGPWGDAERHLALTSELPCAPCGRLDWPRPAEHPCVRGIGVARALAAAQRLNPISAGPGRDL
ncbi:MAG: glycosyltransferase family 9 protein [Chloroflexi bacterium]|nr:glycosyltransferase family 9 protein [Chloroflexota bacterium]